MNNDKKDNLLHKDKPIVSFEYDPSLFHSDYSLYILYRRIDNITAAIHLITDPWLDKEMLKHSLRETSMKNLSCIVLFIGSLKGDISQLQQIVAYILELSSKLNMAFWSGLTSEMNSSLLQKEILKIHETLAEVISKYKTKHTIDPLFFSPVDLDIRHYKNSIPSFRNTPATIKDNYHKRQDKGHIKDINPLEQPLKDDRRQAILKLLSERSNLSIKDFATVIPSYSEKTIQRELLSLVEDGVVKKVGERRWSTYSLAEAKN